MVAGAARRVGDGVRGAGGSAECIGRRLTCGGFRTTRSVRGWGVRGIGRVTHQFRFARARVLSGNGWDFLACAAAAWRG